MQDDYRALDDHPAGFIRSSVRPDKPHPYLSWFVLKDTLREEIFAGVNFRDFFFGHFAGINFRELGFTEDFAGISFREFSLAKDFAGINFRESVLYKDFTGVYLTFALRNIFPRP